MHNIIDLTIRCEEKCPLLNKIKAKIVKFNSERLQGLINDRDEKDNYIMEPPSLYHILQSTKRRQQRTIHPIVDNQGSSHSTPVEILKVFTEFYRNK